MKSPLKNTPSASFWQPAAKRIFILGTVLGTVFVAVSFYLALQFMNKTEEQRLNNLKQMVEIARNSIEPIIAAYRQQKISRDEALLQVRDLVRTMVYHDEDGRNYIFMSAYDGTMLVQPFEPEKEMSNMWELKDSYGVFIIQELIKAARSEQGAGYITYHYMAPGTSKPQEKSSYVIGIPELECYIGTGKYMLDIRSAQKRYIISVFSLTIIMIVLLTLLIRYAVREVRTNFQLLLNENAEHKKTHQALKESEARFRIAFENAAIGRSILQADGSFARVNKSFAHILGMTVDELTSKSWKDVVHQDFIEETERQHRKLLNNVETSVIELELRMLAKGDAEVWTRLCSVLIRDENEQPMYFIQDIENITERLRYQEQLKKYERIVGTSIDQMSLLDKDYVYEAVNDSYLRAHNRKREEIVGRTVAEVNGLESFENIIKPHLDKALNGEIVNYQEEFVFKGFGRRYMDVSYFPYKNEQDQVIGVVVHVKDVTETRAMKTRLLQSQKMEAIGTLAGGIAHDFNNILSAMLGYTELCRLTNPRDDKMSDYLNEIMRAGNRAKELVQQILTFSRRTERKLHPVSVKNIVSEALKLMRASLPSTIEIKPDLKSGAMVKGDPTQIHQILMNLCTNAGYAMRESGGTLEVDLTDVELDSVITASYLDLAPGRYVNLTVRDTGSGMPPEVLERIFDPFYTTKDQGEGAGMGLAVVHGIVKSYGGMIYAYSEPGQGSSFKVFLPMVEDDGAGAGREEDAAAPGGDERILFIDDEPVLVDIGKKILEGLGYRVDTKTDSREALELFRRNPKEFDLVITDMTMPHLTGDVLAKELIAIRRNIPIILCTGFNYRITEEKAEEIGIKSLLIKPITRLLLAQTVRQILDEAVETQ